MKKSKLLVVIFAFVSVLCTPLAGASMIINLVEGDSWVEATYSGSINLGATQGFRSNSVNDALVISPATGVILFTPRYSDAYNTDLASWTSFGPGVPDSWDFSSGDAFKLFGDGILGVPDGYISGTNISGGAIKYSVSYADLGITPGSYESIITNGANTDSVLLIVSSVPVPAAVWLFGSGLIGLIGIAKCKKA